MQIRFIRLIDELFQGVPQTRETLEMKEEIVQNLMEKYNDLRAEGKTEEQAFSIAAASVGDINDIIGGSVEPDEPAHFTPKDAPVDAPMDAPQHEGQSPGNVMSWLQVIAIFIGLIVACPFAIKLFKDWRGPFLGVIMLVCAVGLLVNQIAVTRRIRRDSPYEHEAFGSAQSAREWTPVVENRKLYHSLNSALWTIMIAAYFLISYYADIWSLSWLVFLITPAISLIIKAGLGLTPFRKALTSTFWLMTNVMYFIISFTTGAWAITWVIYLVAAALQNVVKAAIELK